MDRKQGGPVFFIIIILSVLIMLFGILFIVKKDTQEVKDVQNRISTAESGSDNLKDAVNDMDSSIQAGYDDLDESLEDY